MRFEAETLDDALLELYPALLARASRVKATRGDFSELLGVQVEIGLPRARLSRSETRGKPFSCLGELLWYLSRGNNLDFIAAYLPNYRDESEDGVTVYGGYGPRIFQQRGLDQLANVIALLRRRPSSRQAVVQIFNAEDIASKHKDVPCTTSLQFIIRDGQLHLIVTMRSNDAYLGLPHDVFCFTMIQEIVARSLECDIGSYRHFAGSMHLYEKHHASAESFIGEGYQRRIEMPFMPEGDPWASIGTTLEAEARCRAGEVFDANTLGVAPYWQDLVRLLQVLFSRDATRIATLRDCMSFPHYRHYIDARLG